MILSKTNNFIFFHAPKNGGTTVSVSLRPVIENEHNIFVLRPGRVVKGKAGGSVVDRPKRGRQDQRPRTHLQPRKVPQPLVDMLANTHPDFSLRKHSDVTDVAANFDPAVYNDCNKIVFVRNPYARAVSALRFRLRRESPNADLQRRLHPDGRDISLDEFLETGLWKDVLAARPQHYWYDASAPNFFVYKTEEINKKLPEIANDFLKLDKGDVEKVKDNLMHGPRNVSGSSDTWRNMSKHTKALVEDVYKQDFETFGF